MFATTYIDHILEERVYWHSVLIVCSRTALIPWPSNYVQLFLHKSLSHLRSHLIYSNVQAKQLV